jgi:hypothetical protein
MRYAIAFTALAFLPASINLTAQDTPPDHQHHQVAGTTIDGAEHPELIPDLTAYRLYLLAVSEPPSPTEGQRLRQEARLKKVGMKDFDRLALINILASFNLQYHSLIDSYNKAATEAWTHQQRTDPGPLRFELDSLVQSTHDAIRGTLSDDSWTRLDAHVQGEKKRMKISAPEVKP